MVGRRLRIDLDKLEDVVAILVLGAGILAWAAGIGRWWLVLVVGWLVLVPLVDELTDMVGSTGATEADDATDEADTALVALRERYAAGEISEAEFERRVERLLETESVEEARERIREREFD